MPPVDPLADVPTDTYFTRDSGPWALDKLGIVACYSYGFSVACRRARRWYYVDAFAGPGINTLRGHGTRVLGTPLIALRTSPRFRRAVLLEQNRIALDALRARTSDYSDRAVAVRGDANRDLLPLMARHVEPSQPIMCVLDPEGAELEWATVSAIADFKRGQRFKVEQLILLPTDTGFIRELPIADLPADWAERDLNGIFGNDRWREIYDFRRGGALTPDEARGRYVHLYANGLRELGYRTVLDRPILRHGRTGRPVHPHLRHGQRGRRADHGPLLRHGVQERAAAAAS